MKKAIKLSKKFKKQICFTPPKLIERMREESEKLSKTYH